MRNVKSTIFLAGLMLSAGAQGRCLTGPVEGLEAAPETGPGGQAELCFENGRLQAKIQSEGLAWRHVYSAWWVYFEEPSACLEPYACGPRDLVEPQGGTRQMHPDGSYEGGDLPRGVIGRMASGLGLPSGRLALSGELRRFWPGLDSELWLLLMSHGPAQDSNASRLARQLLTPEMPQLGVPMAGRREDGWRSTWLGVATFHAADLLEEGGEP